MSPPPDLRLASSYVPACVCLLKAMLAFMLFVFSPTRGWVGLVCLALVDRILWNRFPDAVLDANSVVMAFIGGLMIMHTRADGVHSLMHYLVVGAWMLCSGPQIMRLTRLPKAYEVIMAAACVSMLSCMHQAQERLEFMALRGFVFVVLNMTLPYFAILMMQRYEPDSTCVNVCRTLLILLGEPLVAAAWVIVCILCVGNQCRARGDSAIAHEKKDHDSTDGEERHNVIMMPSPPKLLDPAQFPDEDDVRLPVLNPPPAEPMSIDTATPEEAAMLRKALAARNADASVF